MADLNDLASYLEQEIDGIKAESSRAAVDVAKKVVRELVATTPVDTSKAISNWQVSLGSPVSNELDAHVLGAKGSTSQQSAQVSITLANAELSKHAYGQEIYISNLADYVSDLNDGTTASRQSPPGFVERAVAFAEGGSNG